MEIYNRPYVTQHVTDECDHCGGSGTLRKKVCIQIDGKPWWTDSCQECQGEGRVNYREETEEATNSEWLSLLQSQMNNLEINTN